MFYRYLSTCKPSVWSTTLKSNDFVRLEIRKNLSVRITGNAQISFISLLFLSVYLSPTIYQKSLLTLWYKIKEWCNELNWHLIAIKIRWHLGCPRTVRRWCHVHVVASGLLILPPENNFRIHSGCSERLLVPAFIFKRSDWWIHDHTPRRK